MSLVEMLGVAPKHLPPEARKQLKTRLNQLLAKPGNRDLLRRLGFSKEPLTRWRVRDLAAAAHRMEHVTDSERANLDFHKELASTRAHDLIVEIIQDIEGEEQALKEELRKCQVDPPAPKYIRSHEFWEIALAVNAAFKGLLGSLGQSGHICARVEAVAVELKLDSGWPSIVEAITEALVGKIHDADVVVVADKVVAAAQNRIGPRQVLMDPDPKTVPVARLPELAARWEKQLGFSITPIQLLLADEFEVDQATLGTHDHNAACAELASAIAGRLGVAVDVMISDTDTGLDTRYPLIGTLTIGATPLGATRGLTLYEAMRCATAAEFVRGHTRRIPVVICIPAERRRKRKDIGKPRGYPGILDAARERGIAHA